MGVYLLNFFRVQFVVECHSVPTSIHRLLVRDGIRCCDGGSASSYWFCNESSELFDERICMGHLLYCADCMVNAHAV
jgi:hypothetical protein